MDNVQNILLFELSGKKFAFKSSDLVRVTELIEITPLPDAPQNILGVINVFGEIIAIGDIKRKLKLNPEKFSLDNQIIIVRFGKRKIGYVVDRLVGFIEIRTENITSGEDILTELKNVSGVININSEIVLINDVKRFFTEYDITRVENAINASI